MADIPNATSNTTLWDESGNVVGITLNTETGLYELATHDQDVFSDGDRSQYAVKDGREFLSLTVLTTISGTAETDFMMLTNPTGSGKIAYLESLVYTPSKGGGIVRLYRNPTITDNGTVLPIVKAKPSSAIASIMNIYKNPIISARGTLLGVINASTLDSNFIHYDLQRMIEPTYTLLVTITPASNNTDHSLFATWEEQ